MKKLKVLIVAAGGYGGQYVQALLEEGESRGLVIEGVVEPYPASVLQKAELDALNVPWYDSAEAFYQEHEADLALISSPIQFHKEQVLCCMEHGSHVLCEKPLCSSPDDLDELIEARDRTGKMLGVGYQWSWAPAVQDFKRDALAGDFGKLLSMKTLIRWPRNTAYFSRGIGWAGKLRAGNGTWILDSIAHNACGHYLHHMLFVAGASQTSCAVPEKVQSVLLRANAIENFDTAMIRAWDADGVSYLFLASHAVEENVNPVYEFRYEKAVVRYEEDADAQIHAVFEDGRERNYGSMGDRFNMATIHFPKLWHMADAIRGQGVIACPPEAVRGQTMTICAAQRSCPVRDFPADIVSEQEMNGSPQKIVPGLSKLLQRCYEENRLPGEADPEWARPGEIVFTHELPSPFTLG